PPAGAACEPLRRVDRGIRPHHDCRIADDGAAPDLSAADAGGVGAAGVAPLAGPVHVLLARFEQLAVARERFGALHIRERGVGAFDACFVAVSPFDSQAFAGEQAFVMGHELRQALERRGGFEDELAHDGSSLACRRLFAKVSTEVSAWCGWRLLARPRCAKTTQSWQ